MASTIAPLLGALFLVLAIGFALRRFAGMGQAQADMLNKIIVDVTMPALVIHVMSERDLVMATSIALVPASVALFLSGLVAFLVIRGPRPTRGSAGLTATFCNTGFLGFPLLLRVFPGDAMASSTAFLVDTVCTTLFLWTLGLAFAQRMGSGGPMDLRAVLRVLLRPMTFGIVIGLVLRATHVELPAFVDGALNMLGQCTSPLVFLSLGLQLDLSALRGRTGSVVVVALTKLVVAPMLCLVFVRAMRLPEPVASVVVLDCAMPTALASVIVAARSGCDRAFAAGVATLTTVLCLASLPAVSWLMSVWP